MKIFKLFFVVAFLFFSLSLKAQGKLNQIIKKFEKDIVLPFATDTSNLSNMDNKTPLGYNDVKLLAKHWLKHDINNTAAWNISEFCKIDSIKASGTYKEWSEDIDGGTKYADAYAVGKAQLDSNTIILVWQLNESSYEACPYSSTQSLYFTVIYKNQIVQSFVLANHLTGSDPPVAIEKIVSGKIDQKGILNIKSYEMNDDDMDAPYLTITKAKYNFVIKSGKIKLLSQTIEKPIKQERKKN